MPEERFGKNLKFEEPATYRIRITGHIDDRLSDTLGGMVVIAYMTKRPRSI